MIITQMTSDMADELAVISAECFSMPWSKTGILSELKNPNSITLVAIISNKVVGFINAHIVLDEGYINNIAVTSIYRNKGIGEKLVSKLLLSNQGLSFLSLEVRRSNQNAIKFYQKCGFKFVGTRKNFYEKPMENALIYTKDII